MNTLRFSSSCCAQPNAANEWCLLVANERVESVQIGQSEGGLEPRQLDLTTSAKIVLVLATGSSMPKETLWRIEWLVMANQGQVYEQLTNEREAGTVSLCTEQKRTLLHVCWFMYGGYLTVYGYTIQNHLFHCLINNFKTPSRYIFDKWDKKREALIKLTFVNSPSRDSDPHNLNQQLLLVYRCINFQSSLFLVWFNL